MQNGAIIFSGITPGGFQGNSGLLFSAVFEAKSEGVVSFGINDAKVLRNDGMGSPAVLAITSFKITISSEAPAVTPAITKIKDTESPESFVPQIAKDEILFEGKWFVAFATQDKASGIDHYEIKESRHNFLRIFKKWVIAESPYVLKDQELRSYVYIKAVDKAGNERISMVEPRYPMRWYETWWVLCIIILSAIIIGYIIRKLLWLRLHIK